MYVCPCFSLILSNGSIDFGQLWDNCNIVYGDNIHHGYEVSCMLRLTLGLMMEYKMKGTYNTKSECHYCFIEEHFKSKNQ